MTSNWRWWFVFPHIYADPASWSHLAYAFSQLAFSLPSQLGHDWPSHLRKAVWFSTAETPPPDLISPAQGSVCNNSALLLNNKVFLYLVFPGDLLSRTYSRSLLHISKCHTQNSMARKLAARSSSLIAIQVLPPNYFVLISGVPLDSSHFCRT